MLKGSAYPYTPYPLPQRGDRLSPLVMAKGTGDRLSPLVMAKGY